jgi:hypothetical protein
MYVNPAMYPAERLSSVNVEIYLEIAGIIWGRGSQGAWDFSGIYSGFN